jgi:hypothetical protein
MSEVERAGTPPKAASGLVRAVMVVSACRPVKGWDP